MLAHVLSSMRTLVTGSAGGEKIHDNMVTHFHIFYVFTDLCDHTGVLMSRNSRICRARIGAMPDVMVTSAYTCGFHLDKDFILVCKFRNLNLTHLIFMRFYNNDFFHHFSHNSFSFF